MAYYYFPVYPGFSSVDYTYDDVNNTFTVNSAVTTKSTTIQTSSTTRYLIINVRKSSYTSNLKFITGTASGAQYTLTGGPFVVNNFLPEDTPINIDYNSYFSISNAAIGEVKFNGFPYPKFGNISLSVEGRVVTVTPSLDPTKTYNAKSYSETRWRNICCCVCEYSTDGVTWTRLVTNTELFWGEESFSDKYKTTYTVPDSFSGTLYFRYRFANDSRTSIPETSEIGNLGNTIYVTNVVSHTFEAAPSISIHDSTLRDKSAAQSQNMPAVTNHDMSQLGRG